MKRLIALFFMSGLLSLVGFHGQVAGQEPAPSLLARMRSKVPSLRDIARMKRFLSVKKNYVCLRHGKGCSLAERKALAAIDTIVAAGIVALTVKAAKTRYHTFADNVNHAALIRAASDGDGVAVQRLLDAGADVNHATTDGFTALIRAASDGDGVAVQRLLDAGADVNHATTDGFTALIAAAVRGHDAIVQQLLAAGADVNHANDQGFTALIVAAATDHDAIVQQLLAAGADVNHANDQGDTALIFAAATDHDAIVQRLLAVDGIDVNHATDTGFTALIAAAATDDDAMVQRLLDAGADVNHATNRGKTAYDLARTQEIKDMLKRARQRARSQEVYGALRFVQEDPTSLLRVVPSEIIREEIMKRVQEAEFPEQEE